MNQNSAIKHFLLFGYGLLMVLNSFMYSQEFFTRDQLIGKGNPEIIGNSKMHKDAKFAFEKMKAHAEGDGIKIEVVSSYRSFEKQKQLFENKYIRFTNEGMTPKKAIDKIIDLNGAAFALEHGVDALLLPASNGELWDAAIAIASKKDSFNKNYSTSIEIDTAKISSIDSSGVGERVCIDLIERLEIGEGMVWPL